MAATVAAAFADDPAWAFMLREDYGRLAARFAAALFEVRVGSESVWVSDDLAAVAMWDPPGKSDQTPGPAELIWTRYRTIAGEDAFRRLRRYNEAVNAASEAEDYWYLGVLATHPARQREGLASAVMTPVLREADRMGIACCLETSTVANRRFYERRGFTQATPVALPDGPPTWWLRRPPAASLPNDLPPGRTGVPRTTHDACQEQS